MAPTLNERVRDRLKERKAEKKVSERDLARWMNWSQPKVAQKLGGRTEITLNELESLCFALDLAPTEAVRDRGLEFCAEMTPTELRILEQLRALDPPTRAAIFHLLNIKSSHHLPERFAKAPIRTSSVKK
jgi:transcriptional regulator with XRE-family HTH domain